MCSTGNLDLVRSIGADHAIDYTQEDFTKNGQHFDLIYDAVGNRYVSDHKRARNPNGTCVIAGFQNLPRLFEHVVLGPWRSKTGDKKVGLMEIAKMNQKDWMQRELHPCHPEWSEASQPIEIDPSLRSG